MTPNYSKEITPEKSGPMQSREFSDFESVSIIHGTVKSGQAGTIVAHPVRQRCHDQDVSCALLPPASRNLKL